MDAKIKRISQRFLVGFLTVCICFCLATPFVTVDATSTSSASIDDNWVDLMPFLEGDDVFLLNSDTFGRYDFIFREAPTTNYYYVDVLFSTDCSDPYVGTFSYDLEIFHIDGNLYRAVGKMFASSSRVTVRPYIFIECYDGSYFQLLSCKASLRNIDPVNISYDYRIVTGYNEFIGTVDIGPDPDPFDLNYNVPLNGLDLSYYLGLTFGLNDMKKFDSFSVILSLECKNITSIRANQGEIPLSFSHNFINGSDTSDGNFIRFLNLTVDLSNVDRFSNIPVQFYIDGTFNSGESSRIFLHGAYGYIDVSSNPIQYWIMAQTASIKSFFDSLGTKLGNWFSTQFSKFDQLISELKILNGRDSEAITAQQTQEEINVSVNNQLVGAVEDWNTNIEVVEMGYDMAFSKTTPALVWVASLADGIFNGMGWFGNVYFLVGLISVIMLVLSKSGLAHKIGSINRRKGD